MKIDRTAGRDARGGGSGPVTAKNYIDRAVAHMRSSGRPNGEHPVIRSEQGERGGKATGELATPNQWRAWMAYFAVLGYPTLAARELGVMTVPAEYPWQFDASAPTEIPPEPAPQARGYRRQMTDEDRVAMQRRFAQLQEAFPPPSKTHWPLTEDEAKARLEMLQASPVPPVRLSPEALAQFESREEIEEPVSEGDPQ